MWPICMYLKKVGTIYDITYFINGYTNTIVPMYATRAPVLVGCGTRTVLIACATHMVLRMLFIALSPLPSSYIHLLFIFIDVTTRICMCWVTQT